MDEEATHRLTSKKTAPPRRRFACLKMLAGPTPGEVIRLDTDRLQIGRGASNDLVIRDAQVSRQHARLDRSDDGYVLLTDLGSTNGTTVEGEPITSRLLKEGDQIAFGDSVVVRFCFLDALEENMERQLYSQANLDALMGLLGRPAFRDRLKQELEVAASRDYPVCVAMLGLDDFKHLNEEFGHPVGDAVLRELAARLRAVLRSRDLLGRFSGEEFVMALPDQPLDHGAAVLERIRVAVARRPFEVPTPLNVRVSAGVGQTTLHGRDVDSLLRSARAGLAQARAVGGNQVLMAPLAPIEGTRQRRHITRLDCSFAVACRTAEGRFAARVVDIGAQGLRLVVPERLAQGVRLDVVPEVGGLPPISTSVLWCRKKRNQEILEAGVSFEDPAGSWVPVALQRLGLGPTIPIAERRRSVRSPGSVQVSLWQGPRHHPARLLNVSAQGLTLESEEALQPLSPVRLELPSGLGLTGAVIYSRPALNHFRTGVRLDQPLSRERVEALADES